jgi:hypothetical protein
MSKKTALTGIEIPDIPAVIRKAQAGCSISIGLLVNKYTPLVISNGYDYNGRLDEDLTQHLFEDAVKALKRFEIRI